MSLLGAETEAPTRVTWALPSKKDATHLSKLQWRLYCVESFSINIRWSIRSKPFLKSAKNNLREQPPLSRNSKATHGVKDRRGPARSIYQLPRIGFYRGCLQYIDGYTLANMKPSSTLASWHVREIGLTSSSMHLEGVTLGRGGLSRSRGEEEWSPQEVLGCKDRQQLAQVQRRNSFELHSIRYCAWFLLY